jgi:hypothetical protein
MVNLYRECWNCKFVSRSLYIMNGSTDCAVA